MYARVGERAHELRACLLALSRRIGLVDLVLGPELAHGLLVADELIAALRVRLDVGRRIGGGLRDLGGGGVSHGKGGGSGEAQAQCWGAVAIGGGQRRKSAHAKTQQPSGRLEGRGLDREPSACWWLGCAGVSWQGSSDLTCSLAARPLCSSQDSARVEYCSRRSRDLRCVINAWGGGHLYPSNGIVILNTYQLPVHAYAWVWRAAVVVLIKTGKNAWWYWCDMLSNYRTVTRWMHSSSAGGQLPVLCAQHAGGGFIAIGFLSQPHSTSIAIAGVFVECRFSRCSV